MEAMNPYGRDGVWYWHDETFEESQPYVTKAEAEVDLTLYGHYLTTGDDLRPRIIKHWRIQFKDKP